LEENHACEETFSPVVFIVVLVGVDSVVAQDLIAAFVVSPGRSRLVYNFLPVGTSLLDFSPVASVVVLMFVSPSSSASSLSTTTNSCRSHASSNSVAC
jgi:hypothetical protein